MNFKIVYEDELCVVFNKPAGVVVNNSATLKGAYTIQNYLQDKYFKGVDFNSGEHKEFVMRSGIIHRLDKDTSGVMIAAKDPHFFNQMLLKFKNREVNKEYLALIFANRLPEDLVFTVDAPIGRSPKNRTRFCIDTINGRSAITDFEIIEVVGKVDQDKFALIRCKPKTGRTHQIRVHLAAMDIPVAGDQLYSGKNRSKKYMEMFPRQMLHASSLEFVHPITYESVRYEAPLADDMAKAIDRLKSSS